MKTKNLVQKVLTIVFSALLIIPTFVSWISGTMSVGSMSETSGLFFSDFTEAAFEYTKSGEALQASEIIFWIAFALAMLLIVLVVAQMLMPKVKVLGLLIKLVGIALLVAAVAAFVCALIWCIANGESSDYGSISYYPLWGSAITLLGGLLGGIFALTSTRK